MDKDKYERHIGGVDDGEHELLVKIADKIKNGEGVYFKLEFMSTAAAAALETTDGVDAGSGGDQPVGIKVQVDGNVQEIALLIKLACQHKPRIIEAIEAGVAAAKGSAPTNSKNKLLDLLRRGNKSSSDTPDAISGMLKALSALDSLKRLKSEMEGNFGDTKSTDDSNDTKSDNTDDDDETDIFDLLKGR